MTTTPTFIPTALVERINATALLEDVLSDFVSFKKVGASLVGECPYCHTKKFTFSPAKKLYKCFAGCEKSGSQPAQFLMDLKSMSFQEAYAYLADRYNIVLEEASDPTPRSNRQQKFRDAQLLASGIRDADQKWFLQEQNHQIEMDRYQAATIDKTWRVITGDDMVLHYLDLDGKPLVYRDIKGRSKSFIRIRWANPSLHTDKQGHPMKYQSPYKSGSQLWIPNFIIQAYKQHQILPTLFICEGEKKADKLCLEGMPAVGIMGIHNFGLGEMPYQFELLIKRCGVKRVVFVLDADWQDLSLKPDKSVDLRPRTFFKAIVNFRRYFYAYAQSGIELDLFFAHGKNLAFKGIDDLLVRELKGKESELLQDFEQAMSSRDGQGLHVNVYNITEMSSYKLKEFWHLQSPSAFLNHYKEVLKELREFSYDRLLRRYNPETDDFELAQAILPHEQFWREVSYHTKSGKEEFRYFFSYVNILEFLNNRGFGLYEYVPDKFRFIHIQGKIVLETNHHKIQRFVQDFARGIEKPEVLELLLRGGEKYLGPNKLANMYYKRPTFNQSSPNTMYLYFKNSFWKISRDEIVQRPLNELPHHVWQDKIIDFEPQYLGKPMLQVDRSDSKLGWEVKESQAMEESDIAQFYLCTSNFHWKKEQALQQVDGKRVWLSRENPEKTTIKDVALLVNNLVCKMIAAGYILHDYRDYSRMKAVICMDGMESEVGKSQGGTGKSIWGKQFQHLVPQVIIDGKKKNIEEDNHLYETVDERTNVILYDDVRVNFNFEHLFSQITTGITINPKGLKRYNIEPPKFIIITNHALNGDDSSNERRQYVISFSDFFNLNRSVRDHFGHQLFHEWDYRQWNLFYNWMANCIQIYLKFGMDYAIPSATLKRRKLRQQIGEKFLSWASLVFDPEVDHVGEPIGIYLNKKVEKVYLCNKYLERYHTERKYIDPKRFKEKLMLYAEYAGLEFNPTHKGDRIKSNSKEYFILADKNFDANTMAKTSINSDLDLAKSDPAF